MAGQEGSGLNLSQAGPFRPILIPLLLPLATRSTRQYENSSKKDLAVEERYLNATSREGAQVEFAYVGLPRNNPCIHASTH